MLDVQPPGHPALLDRAVEALVDSARTARDVAASLRGAAVAGSGLSVDAIGAAAARLSDRVDAMADAYSQVALALREYSTELWQVRARVEVAVRAEREALWWLAVPDPTLLQARGDYVAALAHLDQAADRAIARIVAAGQDLSGWAAGAVMPLVSTALAPAGRFRIASRLALASSPVAAAIIARRVASDVLAPTPEVVPWIDDGTLDQAQARQALNDLVPGSATAIVEGMALVDRAGGSHKAVVDISHFAGPEGEDRWLVTLPSTQDWAVPGGDQPAPNDLDANLAMMLLGPEIRTQYERAVLVGMEQAGVEPGDAVMFAGFSQGGIVAARLASTLHGPYSVGGVLAVGAPIDVFPIPRDIPVLAVQHVFDPVHRLDLALEGAMSDIRVTVRDGPGFGGPGPPLHANPLAAHDAQNYAMTTAHHDRNGTLTAMFSDFVLTDQQAADGWTVERRQFQFTE